jgi:hypothetical protein
MEITMQKKAASMDYLLDLHEKFHGSSKINHKSRAA